MRVARPVLRGRGDGNIISLPNQLQLGRPCAYAKRLLQHARDSASARRAYASASPAGSRFLWWQREKLATSPRHHPLLALGLVQLDIAALQVT